MRTTVASLSTLGILGLLVACERREAKETAADAPPAADTATTSMATTDTAGSSQINWGPAPPFLNAGAKFAVVEGDPSKPGAFKLRLDMPDGYEIRPHHHPMAERVRVIEGTFMRGLGKAWADDKLQTLAAGEEASIAAGQPHFVRVKGQTVVEVAGTGPFEIVYENPADDPRKKPIP
jgi:quercetin dioxygenase-like cupin family protein